MKKHNTLIASIIFLLTFIILAYFTNTNHLVLLDTSIYNDVNPHINFYNSIFMRIITTFGKATILIILTISFIIFTYRRKKYRVYSNMLVFTLISSEILNIILKDTFHRIRPDVFRLIVERSYSFPSGHAMVSICFYGFIIYIVNMLIKNNWKYLINSLLILLIFSIGLSRVYLGIHYTSDIIGGYSFGLCWLLLIIYITEKIKKRDLN